MLTKKVDVAISGGGLVGTLLALLLDQHKWHVALIDPQPTLPQHDGRVLAVNRRSLNLLHSVGVCVEGEPICSVHAYEEQSPWSLNFSAGEVGNDPDLGQMIAYDDLRAALMQRRQNSSIAFMANKVDTHQVETNQTILSLNDGTTLEALLWVGAEGKNSPSRTQHIGIKVNIWDYGQHAIVFHVQHEKNHNGRAYEVFRPNGPVAFLPMAGGHQSCVVWNTSTPGEVQNQSDEEMLSSLSKIFDLYGSYQLISPRWSFPLTHLSVSNYIQPRFALVGDAAHVLHPLAGQGVNLGWRDADVLTRQLVEARKCGLDWGSLSVLKTYEKHQKNDHRKLRGAVNGLHHLFSMPYGAMIRGMGMGLVNAIKPLKRMIIRHAMGYGS